MPASRKSSPAPRRVVLAALSVTVAAVVFLGGCSSWPRMAEVNRSRLQGVSRTVVYVTPAASAAIGHSVAWSNYPFGPSGSDTAGFFLGGLIYTSMQAYYRDQAFARSVSGYRNEIRAMDIPGIEQDAARQAVRGVAWLHGTCFETLAPDGSGDFVHRTVMDAPTRAVIFIYPGSFIRDDAKTVGMSYAVVSYVKVRDARVRVKKLDSNSVTAELPVKYPAKYAHYNELTAPTTSAAAWRLQYLFAGDGKVFSDSLRMAIQRAGWKLECYLAVHCDAAQPNRGFGFQ